MVTYLSSPVFQDISDTNSPPASLLGGASVESVRARFGTDDSIIGFEVETVISIHRCATRVRNDTDEVSLKLIIAELGCGCSHGGNCEENDLQGK